MKEWFSKLENRKTVYNVIVAAIPVMILTGVMVPGLSELVITLAAAILGVGGAALASGNSKPVEAEPETDTETYSVDEEALGE